MTTDFLQLRRLFRVVNGGTPTSEPRFWGGDVWWFTPEDLGSATGRRLTVSRRTLTAEGQRAAAPDVPEGSLLLSTRAPIGHVGILGVPASFNQGCRALVPRVDLDSRYFYWHLVASRGSLNAAGQGSTFVELSGTALAEFRVRAPAKTEQRRTADFLDAETARIDALVAARRRQAQLLVTRRSSLMFAAVSGALGPPRARRPSDLEWLSTLPEDWSELKLTRVARLGSGHTPSRSHPEWWLDCTIPWITTGEVAQIRDDRREVLLETRENISEIGLANSAAELRPAGTVVLSRTASAGYSALMGTDMATSQDFVTWTCSDRLLPRFLLFCLRAMRSDLLGRLAMGSTHRTIYFPDIESIRIPLPSVAEQQRLLDLADEQLAALGPLEAAIDRQITLLRERRQALITAAVSGRVDVGG